MAKPLKYLFTLAIPLAALGWGGLWMLAPGQTQQANDSCSTGFTWCAMLTQLVTPSNWLA